MNYLSKNIKYLRKSRKWSQEELAAHLRVKRSSIAAYESKNVRPQLDFIVEFARLFDIRLSDLVERDMESTGTIEKVQPAMQSPVAEPGTPREISRPAFDPLETKSLELFIERCGRIRKMLEGFKVFYRFKLENYGQISEEARRLTSDIDNLLMLIEHLLAYNEDVIRMVSRESEVKSN